MSKLSLLLTGCLIVFASQTRASAPPETQANVSLELTFHARHVHQDPFNEVTLDAEFTDPNGKTFRVPGFWDGGSVWKVRYASPEVGKHTFRLLSSDETDSGLNGVTGEIKVLPYNGVNPLFEHGPLRVALDHRHFSFADGKPFFWLGDTWWMGLAQRLRWPDEFQSLAGDRVKKGFTVVQIVAGLYPDMFPFDPRGANEAGFPWEPNYHSIRPSYFDRADDRLRYLVDQGITPCLVGAWGYFMSWMGPEKLKRHWRYLIARYGSYSVVWCAAGEANLPWYLAPKFPYDDRDQVHEWTEVLRYIRQTDPFHRLLTIHPTAINSYSSRHATDDPNLLDFDMLQTPHGRDGAADATRKQMVESTQANPIMPVIDGEASYEMLSDSLPTDWTRAMFWICMASGAAGHTYGANGIWQNNLPGDPHGRSPNGPGYGKIPSSEAMHLPGSAQEGMGKALLESLPWYQFQPFPNGARYEASDSPSLGESDWIWFPEGKPQEDAPIGSRFFRAHFQVTNPASIKSVRLLLTADDAADAFLNGTKIGSSKDWTQGMRVDILVNLLKVGDNVLAVRAENVSIKVDRNPAGLIATLQLQLSDNSVKDIHSDASWRTAQTAADGWQSPTFDDSSWRSALDLGRYGMSPWGSAAALQTPLAPLTVGIVGQMRVTYVLRPQTIVERDLTPGTRYQVRLFDPVTGDIQKLGIVRASTEGTWTYAPPGNWSHDWVLIMELVKNPLRGSGS